MAFEAAEKEADAARRDAWLTFVVIGGGPTGVEMAGTMAEIARQTLPGEFRRIDPASARVLLLEGSPRVLQAMPESLSTRACEQLARLGVEVRTGARVTAIDAEGLRGAAGRRRGLPHRQPLHRVGRRRRGLAARARRRADHRRRRSTAPAGCRSSRTSACPGTRRSA